MAFEAPSGLMGMPKDIENFEAFEVKDVVMYIAVDVIDKYLKNKILYIYIEGLGRYQLEIIE